VAIFEAGASGLATGGEKTAISWGIVMKRIVLCFDGTWNTLTNPDEVTNVVRVGQALKAVGTDGVPQVVYYNNGVGSGGPIDRFLGGVFGVGVKSNVKRGLTFLSFNYDSGDKPEDPPDEIYIFGFSRGAYTARALAGVLGAIGGIPIVSKFGEAEKFWTHYRKKQRTEADKKDIAQNLYPVPKNGKLIKCVAVWDTVGSYGIPTGIGLGGLARWLTSWTRNFRDNEIGKHIEYGFHAMAIDERRRAFSATAWVPRHGRPGEVEDPAKQQLADPDVEQVWFAGAHANVGGGYIQTGLSDHALIWMMARVQEKTGLEFDEDYVRDNFWPCSACSAYRSYRGWWVSSIWPAIRTIPKVIPKIVKTAVGAAGGAALPGQGAILDGRVHWSVKERLKRISLVDQDRYEAYLPKNLLEHADDIVWTEKRTGAQPEDLEVRLIDLCLANGENKRKETCALYRSLQGMDSGWRWWVRARARRMRQLRDKWRDILVPQA
jgi:uncharacterized protein (DUF2235 family)